MTHIKLMTHFVVAGAIGLCALSVPVQASESNNQDSNIEIKGDTNISTDDAEIKVSTESIKNINEQTMIINKIIAKEDSKIKSDSIGINADSFQHVKDSTFVIYDVTSLLNNILDEYKTSDGTDLSSTEELEKIQAEVLNRASKLNTDELKVVDTIKTSDDGTAKVKLPVDGVYHAYYIVNTETPKDLYVSNSKPLVVLTPMTNDNGEYVNEFTVYPKSEELERPKEPTPNNPEQPKEVTSVQMIQTGHTSLFDKNINWFTNNF